MEVKLDKRYPLKASVDQAWAVLRDVRTVAGCMPGASITEQVDDTHYKGAVKIKVGPATAAFAGEITVHGVDAAARQLGLLGKGADKSGSTASMDLLARVEPGDEPGTSVLAGGATVQVNGKFAQFGGRMMVQVSEMILAQFAAQFDATAQAVVVDAPAAAAPAEAPGAAATAATAAVTAGAAADAATGAATAMAAAAAQPATSAASSAAAAPAASSAAAAPAAATAAPARPAAPVVVAPPPPQALNAGAIVWQLIKNWFAGLFGRRNPG